MRPSGKDMTLGMLPVFYLELLILDYKQRCLPPHFGTITSVYILSSPPFGDTVAVFWRMIYIGVCTVQVIVRV